MENLINLVAQKANIPQDKANAAVQTVLSFLKEKLPPGISQHLDTFISDKNPQSFGAVGDELKDTLEGVYEKKP